MVPDMVEVFTPEKIRELKGKRKILSLTAYDFPFAHLIDHSEVDIILVGDSIGMVIFGDDSTKNVTLDDMMRATASVRKGVVKSLLVSDMPIGTFDTPEKAVLNAKKLQKAGADAVKIEGYGPVLEIVEALRRENIEVMGHLGLTPQTAEDFKVKGKTEEEAEAILEGAKALDTAGIFSLVLECIPNSLAEKITNEIKAPTIGIGAGNGTDGQILVTHDILNLFPKFRPKFVRPFADLPSVILKAITEYKNAVQSGDFPNENESFHG